MLAGDHSEAVTDTGHHDTSEPTRQDEADADLADQAAETDDTWRQRITDLETANAQLENQNTELGKYMAELRSENTELRADNADLRRGVSALETRMERLEKEQSDSPSAAINGKMLDSAERADKKSGQVRGRDVWMSNEAFGFAAMTGGSIATTVADCWSYLPATYAGITASVLGVGASALALVRKRREVRDGAH
jgi:regulator of replication initiation timing